MRIVAQLNIPPLDALRSELGVDLLMLGTVALRERSIDVTVEVAPDDRGYEGPVNDVLGELGDVLRATVDAGHTARIELETHLDIKLSAKNTALLADLRVPVAVVASVNT